MVTCIKFDYVIRVRTFLVYLILVGYLVLAIVDTLFLRISRVTSFVLDNSILPETKFSCGYDPLFPWILKGILQVDIHRSYRPLVMHPCNCKSFNCNGAEIPYSTKFVHQKADAALVRKARLDDAKRHRSDTQDMTKGPTLTESTISPASCDAFPVETPSGNMPPLPSKDHVRIQQLYGSLVNLDHKMQRHANVLTTTPEAILSVSLLQNEEAWLQGTLQSLHSVETLGDNATGVLLIAMVDRINAALRDVGACRVDLENAAQHPVGVEVFETGTTLRMLQIYLLTFHNRYIFYAIACQQPLYWHSHVPGFGPESLRTSHSAILQLYASYPKVPYNAFLHCKRGSVAATTRETHQRIPHRPSSSSREISH